MKKYSRSYRSLISAVFILVLLISFSCRDQKVKKLVFKDYPEMKIGFTTQNFQRAMPNNIENLTEIIEYAFREGYHFIELRDDYALLTAEECKALAEVAGKMKIEVIYEIQKNPLDDGYFEVFHKGLANTLHFSGPGILRAMVANSEFVADLSKKGWTRLEFEKLARITDSCALIAQEKGIRFIVENFDESFFGEGINYFGLSDLLDNTEYVGLQFDTGNPFRKTSREKSDPEKVSEYLSGLGNRWVSSHLKTIVEMGGDAQPVLTDSPLSVRDVIALMGEQDVLYAALELAAVNDKQKCFENHKISIQFLKDIGVLE
jgi:sugar phosphate isomerase/epimerase